MDRRSFIHSSLAALAPPRERAEALDASLIGANTAISGYSLAEAIGLLHRLVFFTIEIHIMGSLLPNPGQFPGFQFDRLTRKEKQAIAGSLRGFRHLSTHLPYTHLNFFASDETVARASVREIEIALEATAYFGAELAVIHALPASGFTPDEVWPVTVRRLREWGDRARKGGFRLAVETGYPKSVRAFVRLIEEIDHPSVGCAIDVGHQSGYQELLDRVSAEQRSTAYGIRAYNDTTLAIIEQLGGKVFHLHVHDIDPQTWKEHQPIGTGFVDYLRLVGKLRDIDYRGLLVLEIAAPAPEMPARLAESKLRLERFLSRAVCNRNQICAPEGGPAGRGTTDRDGRLVNTGPTHGRVDPPRPVETVRRLR